MNLHDVSAKLKTFSSQFSSRRHSLLGQLDGGPHSIESNGDAVRLDVTSLERGLYFLDIKFDFDNAPIGPYLTVARPEFETRDHIFTFSSYGQQEFFGTVLIVDDIQALAFYPSRLPCNLIFRHCSLKRINGFSRDYIYGQPYVRWRVFGASWTLDRYKQELIDGLRRLARGGVDDSYASWWKIHGQRTDAELEHQRQECRSLAGGSEAAAGERSPDFSIIMPVYKSPLPILRAAVDSVLAQTYPHWELCICDDASSDPTISAYLAQISSRDPRIKYRVHQTNKHISAASNTAIRLASGEYLGFLDHDDTLTPDALYEVAKAVAANPDLALIYSDEDVVSADGKPLSPHFKPDWNYDLVRAVNYVCHFLVIERQLVDACGGFREGFEGAQDFDLVLRVTEQIDRHRIAHIPRVLYHWRAVEGSTAQDINSKPYATDAGLRSLEDHIERCQLPASVSVADLPTTYRLKYQIALPAPSVSIIVPTHNNLRVLKNCITALLSRTNYPDWEILIVDNRSDNTETLEYLGGLADDKIRVLAYPHPFNFSAINNFAVSESEADIVVLLNNDTEVIHSDWLDELVAQVMRPGIGAVGAKLFYANGYIQHAGVLLGMGYDRVAGHAFKGFHRDEVGSLARTRLVQEYSAVTAACLAITREKYLEVGGLDDKNLPVAFNDVDFCLRLMDAGYRNVWTPFVQMYHYESATRGYDVTAEKRARFVAERDYMHSRWGELLAKDPNYNPNLTRDYDNFGLAWPPEMPSSVVEN
ncbi:MAG: glycosyltransferase involved in cell wall biosynthesis [Alcanivorax sp.]|jgi:glycosyltransferase involved in cell wall biosynthesis